MKRNIELSKEDFKDMLELNIVDSGSGLMFDMPQKRPVGQNRLTLVIGIGGSGCAAIRRTLDIADRKLDKEYSTYVKFLAVDSATDELEQIKRHGIDSLNISSPMAEIRLAPHNRSVFYKQFIPDNFPVQFVNEEGSSQIRLIGKVKLYDKSNETTNDQLLQYKILGIFNEDWVDLKTLPVDIIVISGIAGGTGSGTFIDIATWAKKACPSPANVTVYGYIMLPDTVEKCVDDNEAKRRLYSNGFAALKELESYESLGSEIGRKELVSSSNSANDVELTNINIPYNYPILISGDYEKAIGMIAETIVNDVADNGGAFSKASFFANSCVLKYRKLSKDVVSRNGVLKLNECPEDSHKYCSIGYAQMSIPEKVVIPHFVGKVCKMLYEPGVTNNFSRTYFCTKERSLSRQDYKRLMRELLGLSANVDLSERTLWAKINMNINRSCRIGDNAIRFITPLTPVMILQCLKDFDTDHAVIYATDKIQRAVCNELEAIKIKALKIMKMYGPRAMQYLYDGTGISYEDGTVEDNGAICLKNQIKFVNWRLSAQKNSVMPRMEKSLSPIQKIINTFGKSKTDEWVSAVKTYIETDVRYRVVQNMKGDDGIWQKCFVAPLEDYLWSVSRFADVLETMGGYYEEVGKSLDEDDYRMFANQGCEINDINICRDADIYAWVKKRISDKLSSIKIQDVKDTLIDDFSKNTDAWISNETGVARKTFDEIMGRACAIGKYAESKNGMNLTVIDYFDHVFTTAEPIRQKMIIANTVREIIQQLLTKSRPCLNVKQGTELICNGTIMLPRSLQAGASGTLILQAFQTELASSGVVISNLVYSAEVDSIVCYQISVANAINDLENLTVWEDAYEACRDGSTHLHNGEFVSLHMDTGYSQYNELTMEETAREKHVTESRPILPYYADRPDAKEWLNRIYGTGLSWMHYPSINVTRYGSGFEGQGGTKEAAYRGGLFREKIEEALRIGIIECEKEGNNYKYYINLIPREWTKLKVRGYKEKNKEGNFIRGKLLFEHLAKQNPQYSQYFRKQIFLWETPFFDETGFDFTDVISVEHWDPERIAREHKAYLMRMMRKSTGLFQDMEDTMWRLYPVEAELEEKEQRLLRYASYKKFFNAYLFGFVNADETESEWTATVDEVGNTKIIVQFSESYLTEADEISRKAYNDGLRLKLVYDKYERIRSEYILTDERFDRIQKKIYRNMTDDELDDMIDKREKDLERMLSVYKEKYGVEFDPISAIMDEYGLGDYQIEEIESLVDFYEELGNVLLEYDNLF